MTPRYWQRHGEHGKAMTPGPWRWDDAELEPAVVAADGSSVVGAFCKYTKEYGDTRVCIDNPADARAIECVPEMVQLLERVAFGAERGLSGGNLNKVDVLLAYIANGGEKPEV